VGEKLGQMKKLTKAVIRERDGEGIEYLRGGKHRSQIEVGKK